MTAPIAAANRGEAIMMTGLSEMQIAATVHARYRDGTLTYQAITGTADPARAAITELWAEPGDGGTTCPTCEGDCAIPACTDPSCGCHLDPPCREVACPTCGGLGSV